MEGEVGEGGGGVEVDGNMGRGHGDIDSGLIRAFGRGVFSGRNGREVQFK